jgi:uncharacterized protein YegL
MQAAARSRGTRVSDQIAFKTDDFATNPEPRCPCVLLLDVSGSMGGAPIQQLNAGLKAFREELQADTLAMKRVEVAVVTFGPVTTPMYFTGAEGFAPPELTPQGDTPMGQAITEALRLVRQRKDEYRTNGISYYRPWIFLITDGAPTDSWAPAAAAIREGEAAKQFAFFAVGVQNASMDILKQISVRAPLHLDGLKFRELFSWLSSSLGSVSRSTPNTEVPLASPQGWASV